MSLATVAYVKIFVRTTLSDSDLQAVIDVIEGRLDELVGAAQDGSVELTEVVEGGMHNVFTKRKIDSVTSIAETDDAVAVDSTGYRVWEAQGRIERLPSDAVWSGPVTIVYAPVNQNNLRKDVIVDLVRLRLERTAMVSEGVGEYNYSAPDWDKAERMAIRRLSFTTF